MSTEQSTTGTWIAEALLVGGFLAFLVAVISAYTSPASGYELSVYGATPTSFWIGLSIAFLVALAVAPTVASRWLQGLALVLGGLAAVAVPALPLLRGYHYHGTADAMTHLGWTRDLAAGALSPFELIYPSVHTTAVVVGRLGGMPVRRSLMLAVVVASLSLLVFVPLTARAVAGPGDAAVFGAFAAFMLLPINTIGTHAIAHPFTQTVLYSAFVLYLLVRYVRQPGGADRAIAAFDPTAIGALLAVAGAAAVVYHPQQAANLLLVFAAVSAFQLLHRLRSVDHPADGHRTLYAQTAFLGVVWGGWTLAYGLLGTAEQLAWSVALGVLGESSLVAPSAQSQGASLAAIGVGLHEIFLKLFLPATVFSALAGLLIVASLLGLLDGALADRNAVVAYLSVGTLAVLPVVAAYLFSDLESDQYLRHFGFVMVLASVLGGLALARWRPGRAAGLGRAWRTTAIVVVVALLLPISLLTVFPSPYIYKATQHVSDAQMEGYETAFEIQDEGVPLLGVRQGAWRYHDGIHGSTPRGAYRGRVPFGELDRVDELFDGPRYLVVTRYDREREVGAYRELRYDRESFDALDAEIGVDRVYANGEVSLYRVEG